MTNNKPLAPNEAFDTAMGVLEEYLEQAQYAIGDGTTVEHPVTMLATGTMNLSTMTLRLLAAHRPVLGMDGAWGCPACVEMHPLLGSVRPAAPCAVAQHVLGSLLNSTRVHHPAPGGLQTILQDGTEPYVSLGAAELERMCGLPPAVARTHSSVVVQAISRIRHRAPYR